MGADLALCHLRYSQRYANVRENLGTPPDGLFSLSLDKGGPARLIGEAFGLPEGELAG